MPEIPEYTANAELEPSDRGIQAAEVAGRRIGLYGQQLKSDADEVGQAAGDLYRGDEGAGRRGRGVPGPEGEREEEDRELEAGDPCLFHGMDV